MAVQVSTRLQTTVIGLQKPSKTFTWQNNILVFLWDPILSIFYAVHINIRAYETPRGGSKSI